MTTFSAKSGWTPEAEIEFLARVEALVEERIGPMANEVGKVDEFAWDTFRLLASEGVFATAFPTRFGGSEAPMRLRVRIIESIARVCSAAASMVTGTDLSGRPIAAYAPPDLAAQIVPRLATGELQCAFALTERAAGSDVAGLTTTAHRQGDSWVLNGIKRYITRAPVADMFIVVARGNEVPGAAGLTAFLVDRNSPGLEVGPMQPKLGWYGSPIAEVFLRDVEVNDSRRLGDDGKGFTIAQDTLIRARIGHAAIAIGRAQGAIEMAAQYSTRRRTFGRSLGEHQGVQWMLADMATQLEASRCLMQACARRYDAGDPEIAVHASMAKVHATDLGMRITTDCLQLFGGNGYLKDFPLERFMRDAKLNQIGEGSSEIHKTVIGRHLVRKAANALHPCLDLSGLES
ncbi:acyl-CoA dehydrogenase family protein [Zeimonas arvi]|uniref:3-sulfinopropanoyl-CoA desulfinase n=1 Tax=Zeimonas arvi TaxID=2498847 RepID=A0A5C8NVV1_9BURK|nr:acyl-CoA dehydrogenase family protein [Zeimonas arvi]TXL65306.1 acyl-CoA dehydrogenase [Zeimonas arvi]